MKSTGAQRHDLAAVLTHELGHALGLGHSTDPRSTMYPDLYPDDTRARNVGADDRAGIAAIYATVSSAPGASAPEGSAPVAGKADDDAAQAATGCSMAGHTDGNPLALAVLLLAFAALRVRATRRALARTA
jgi:uncharacterized protein (TIGR03382 family)